MRYRKAAWITLLTCVLVLLLIWSISPVLWSEAIFTICFYTTYVALIIGLIAAVYLLVVYAIWLFGKARKLQ